MNFPRPGLRLLTAAAYFTRRANAMRPCIPQTEVRATFPKAEDAAFKPRDALTSFIRANMERAHQRTCHPADGQKATPAAAAIPCASCASKPPTFMRTVLISYFPEETNGASCMLRTSRLTALHAAYACQVSCGAANPGLPHPDNRVVSTFCAYSCEHLKAALIVCAHGFAVTCIASSRRLL